MADGAQNPNIEIKRKSEDEFEKNMVYITAGTLVLSLTFIEKIVNLKEAHSVWILVVSWILLTLSLLGNLMSHQLAILFALRGIKQKKFRRKHSQTQSGQPKPDYGVGQWLDDWLIDCRDRIFGRVLLDQRRSDGADQKPGSEDTDSYCGGLVGRKSNFRFFGKTLLRLPISS